MTDETRIRVFCVDDHPLLREGIILLIDNQPDMTVVGQASTGQQAIEGFREHRPDIVLMDIRLPDMSGIEAMIAIRREFGGACFIMLTTSEGDVEIRGALEAGARGYMLKSMAPKEIVDAVRQVHAGKKRIPPAIAAHLAEHYSDETITAREIEVLHHIAGATETGTSPTSFSFRKNGYAPSQRWVCRSAWV